MPSQRGWTSREVLFLCLAVLLLVSIVKLARHESPSDRKSDSDKSLTAEMPTAEEPETDDGFEAITAEAETEPVVEPTIIPRVKDPLDLGPMKLSSETVPTIDPKVAARLEAAGFSTTFAKITTVASVTSSTTSTVAVEKGVGK